MANSLRLNQQQQRAVEVNMNCIVQAGAGSGKTRILSERYLYYVCEKKVSVTNILALTFTRKAAEEMRARIYQSLLQQAPNNSFAAAQLALFEQAHISTFDSFCMQIATNAIDRYGIHPSITIDHQRHRQIAHHVAYQLISRHQHCLPLIRLLEKYGYNRLQNDLFEALATRLLTPIYKLSPESQCQNIAAHIHTQSQHEAKKIAVSILLLQENPYHSPAFDKIQEMLSSYKEFFQEGQPEPAVSRHQNEELQVAARHISEIKLQFGGRSADIHLLQAKEELRAIKNAAQRLCHLFEILPELDNLQELYQLIAEYGKKLLQVKRGSGILTYHDIAAIALDALQHDDELWSYYTNTFHHILVDEFQDNNSLQRDLLVTLLTTKEARITGINDPVQHSPTVEGLRNNALFLVGDAKQSIYLFRGAQVHVFQEIVARFVPPYGEVLPLNTNYRSSQQLITIINSLFHIIMNQSEEIGANRYESAEASWQGSAHNTTPSPLALWYLPAPSSEVPANNDIEVPTEAAEGQEAPLYVERHTSEAYHIAEYISNAVKEQRIKIMDGSSNRPPMYGDFAILLRTKSYQRSIERMLSYWDIPYQSHDPSSLFIEPPISDLYQMMRLLCDRNNREAYMAVLRSPFVALKQRSILLLLRCEGAAFSHSADTLKLPAEECRRLQIIENCYHQLYLLRASLSPCELIDRLWFNFGYCLMAETGDEREMYSRSYHLLTQIAIQHCTIHALVDDLGQRIARAYQSGGRSENNEYERESAYLFTQDSNCVQLLTIHKAKGLEFPVVILADAANQGRNKVADLWWVDEKLGLLLALPENNMLYKQHIARREVLEQAELERLLYVALTRAAAHVIVTATLPKRGGTNPERPRSMWELISESCEELRRQNSAINIPQRELTEIPLSALTRSPINQKRSQQRWFGYLKEYAAKTPFEHYPTQYYHSATEFNSHWLARRNNSSDTKIARRLVTLDVDIHIMSDEQATTFGSLAHALLTHVSSATRESLASFSLDRLLDLLKEQHGSIVMQLSRRFNVDGQQAALRSAQQLVRNFLSDPLCRTLFAEGVQIKHELPFLYMQQMAHSQHYLSGIIDFLAICPNSPADQASIYIIDFKSDIDYQPSHYLAQLACYQEAVRRSYGLQIIPIIYWLRSSEAQYLSDQRETMEKILKDPALYQKG